jgi:crossover junction endodeoxyribonuclease RusA
VPFSISIALRRQNLRQDIDNRSKAILDCLQHYGVIKNDNLCERLSMHWDADLPAECIVILQVAEEAIAA